MFSCCQFPAQFKSTVEEIVDRSIVQYRVDGDLTNLIDFTQREVRKQTLFEH